MIETPGQGGVLDLPFHERVAWRAGTQNCTLLKILSSDKVAAPWTVFSGNMGILSENWILILQCL